MPRQPLRLLLAIGLGAALAPVLVSAQDLQLSRRAVAEIEREAQDLLRAPLQRAQLRSPRFVEERLADGELFFRLKDYLRASIYLTDIVDNHPQHPAYADALFLLSDSLFRAGDNLGARSHFRKILDRAEEPTFRHHVQRTLGRLIEIALHTRDFDGVDGYFTRMSRLPPSEAEAATAYYRAKYLYNKAAPLEEIGATVPAVDQQGLEQARVAFEAVSERSPYYAQARYFIGVIHTVRGQINEGTEAFRRVLRSPATTSEQQAVVDLAQIALGRLYYEADQIEQSIEAYRAVSRTSPNYDDALYEVAWAHIRQGDATAAERALEILAVAAPESQHIPDGKILRGNLLLRDGRFSPADDVFKDVAQEFGPVRDQLNELVARRSDAAGYFRQLVRDNMEAFDANAFLPVLARRWSVLDGDMERALAVLGDLAEARRLVKETTNVVVRLNAALASANRVNVFADLRASRERTTVLRTRVSRVRQDLMAIESRAAATAPGLAEVREKRRALEAKLASVPSNARDTDARNRAATAEFVALDRELSRLDVQVMGLEARITATDRFVSDTVADGAGAEATRAELQTQRAAIAIYREQIQQIKMQIEIGRLQVGVGDTNDSRDREVRAEYDALVAQEREIIRVSGGGNSEIDALHRRLAAAVAQFDQQDGRIEQVVEERTASMREVIDDESVKLDGYRGRLVELERETEEVIGGVTFDNYRRVQQRFYDLVLRADVGRIDISWAEREEHRMRVEMLTRSRVRDTQALEDEYREIMDEGRGPEAGVTP